MPFSLPWIYVLDADYSVDLSAYITGQVVSPLSFKDDTGTERMVIPPDGTAIIRAHYAWDGCTPKFALLDIVIGIPDGVPNDATKRPKAYHASLVHDALYQFLDAGLPISRRMADRAFLDLLKRDGFALRHLYWAVVRVFGGLARRITALKRGYPESASGV